MQQQQNKWHHWHVCTAELKHPETAFPASVSLWSGDKFDVSRWPKGLTTVEGLVHSGKFHHSHWKMRKWWEQWFQLDCFFNPKSILHGNSGGKNPEGVWVGQELSMEKGSDEPTHHSLKHGWPHMDKIKTDGFLWFNDLTRSIGSFVSNKFQKR